MQIREKIRKEFEYKEIEINAVLVQEKIRGKNNILIEHQFKEIEDNVERRSPSKGVSGICF